MLNIYKMLPYIFFFFFFYSSACLLNAQNTIIGKVLGQGESTPIAGARVFLAGTIIGDISSNRGSFQLKNIPSGTYQIVISSLGYKLCKQTITIEKSSRDTTVIVLEPNPIRTGEVQVNAKRPPDFRMRVQEFTRLILGNSANGQQAELLNPDALDFSIVAMANGTSFYEVSAREPLLIYNKRLGYNVTFILEKGGMDGERMWFQGPIHFEELPPKDSLQYQQWQTNRSKTGEGSIKHFIWTLINASFQSIPNYRGFRARRILNENSYLKNWVIAGSPLMLDSIPIIKDSIGTGYKVFFPPCFEIIYSKASTESSYQSYFRNTAFDDSSLKGGYWQPRTLVAPQKPIVHVDKSGFLYSPNELLLYGYWGWQRISDEVPLSYYAK
jgi:CarboxypepD_reg-like domain